MSLSIKGVHPSVRVVPSIKISLISKISSGAFGVVYEGKINIKRGNRRRERVALKISKHGDSLDYTNMVKEVNIMADLTHNNIVRLIGVTTCSPVPAIILELLDQGDLLDFLNHRKETNTPLSQDLMIQMSLDVAHGMEYLHWKKLVVHCDLHTKNCMVGSNDVVKVGDFGLSRKLESEAAEEAMLSTRYVGELGRPETPPHGIVGARWKAPELIPGRYFKPVFARPCDVWAFGILLYEFWADGRTPYSPSPSEEMEEFITSGRTPLDCNMDLDAPGEIIRLMKATWSYSPNLRPTFRAIVNVLTSIANFPYSSASDSDSYQP